MTKLLRIFFLVFSFFSLSAFRHIPQGATEEILNQALQGQSLIFNRRYPEAKALFSQLAQQYPDSALGSFGLMALYNAQMFENFDFSLDSTFEEEQKRNKIVVDKIAKNESSSAWENFLCGASSGLRGFYYVRKDEYLKAMGESGQAKKCLERALNKDPAFTDVYLGLGLYDYWRSVFTSRIKFLPFFKDRRKEGIEQIQRAINESIVAGDLALAAMTFVYHEQNNGAKGVPLAQTLLDKYPSNIMMRNLKGNFLSLNRKFPEAQATLDEVLAMAPEVNVARYFKALAYNRAGDKKMAAATFQEFLDHNPPKAWQAYAHYMLGVLALQDGKREEAWKHFKAGENAYGDYTPNLKMILKMRRGEV
ncbi:MAG TPA: tetratricopeptide repeat protein [bacterium]|nr:tetratricopeptide repeat protein [bacterium]